jgi:hypothetical protein
VDLSSSAPPLSNETLRRRSITTTIGNLPA